ncbi:Hypothetical Protein FCC1311_045102 [Hondaea fermentalgiana]|uniref:Uncharacterized protein n=1 Tax=Hondaea fermentalgiana TaxID=2315210 RepID=A0A2R5GBB3_9STRA|nr:Hypothetical Protein FCC1311_045102 [Hondaea fermentalgiana]|eukprot:GBG28287.1 Hypothetical Protein FCC1311_045102 [Hondaea fermentalgiana]
MAPPMHDELKSTSRHFIVAVALQAQEKPVTAVDELKRGVRKEYPIKYLEEIGAVPTPQNIALVEKEMGIDTNCKVSAAWKSRGSVHDSLYVAPKFPNQSLDAAAAAAAAEGGETLHAKEIAGNTSAASSSLTGTPLDFAIVNASLARQEQAMLDKVKVQRYMRPEARNKTQRQHFPGRRRQRPLRPGKTLYDNSKDESRSGDDLINDHGDVEATIAFLEAILNEGDKGLLLDGTQELADPDADPNTASTSQQRRARGVKLKLRFHSVDELKADFAALDVLNGAEAMSLTVPRSLRLDQDIGKPCVLERIPLTAAMMEELQEPLTLVLGRHREQLENVLKELNLLCLRANLGGLIQVGPVLNIVDHACMLVFRQILLKHIDADGLGASRELPDAAACRSALLASFRLQGFQGIQRDVCHR